MNRGDAPPLRRLLVVLPNWVGDVVLATPVLAALRDGLPGVQITYLMRPYVAEIVAGGGWHDGERFWPTRGRRDAAPPRGLAALVADIRRDRYDAALLLSNSFRSALVAALARIPRRIGYARDGRSALLTQRLWPARRNGDYLPTPMFYYYAALARRLGCAVTCPRLRLGVTPEQERDGRQLKRHYALDDLPYAIVNPGAAYGAAKCWPADRFAQTCDRLSRDVGLRPVLVGAGAEAALLREIAAQARCPVVCCTEPATSLGSLKVLVRDAQLLVCNDTGPRHYGNAFDVPTLTIFGPTFQAWTDTGYAREIKLQEPVACGPCMLRTCPLDHRCMTRVTVDSVMASVHRLLARPAVSGSL